MSTPQNWNPHPGRRAMRRIMEVGVDNLMDDDMGPREVANHPRFNPNVYFEDLNVRPLDPSQWTTTFIIKLAELIDGCPRDLIKSKLRQQMLSRQANGRMPEPVRRARGLINGDIQAVIDALNSTTSAAGTKRGREDSPQKGEDGDAPQNPDKRAKYDPTKENSRDSKPVKMSYRNARARIKSMNIDELMDSDMRPREPHIVGGRRKKAKINEPETRILKIEEWEGTLTMTLNELIDACESSERVKDLLSKEIKRRQSDSTVAESTRLVRGALLRDIRITLEHIREQSNASSKKEQSGTFPKKLEGEDITRDSKDSSLQQQPPKKTNSASGNKDWKVSSKTSSEIKHSDTSLKKRERHDSPLDGEDGVLQQEPQKKMKRQPEEDDDGAAKSLQKQSQMKMSVEKEDGNVASKASCKKPSNPFLEDMLARQLVRLKEIKEAMGDEEESVEGEAAKFTDHFMATNELGMATRALGTTSQQDFNRACFELYLLDMKEQRARLAHERIVVAMWCADISNHLEKTIGLVIEDDLKQQFLSVIP